MTGSKVGRCSMTALPSYCGGKIFRTEDVIPTLSHGPFVATTTGLQVVGEVSYELWAVYGAGLQNVHRAIHWLIGDWINLGERLYGETYTQAIDDTGYTYQTLANDAFVSRRIGPERRHEELSHEHHAAVASLEPDEQDAWLDDAEENGWTRDELRHEIRRSRAPDTWIDDLRRLRDDARRMLVAADDDGDVDALRLVVDVLTDRIVAER